MSYINLIKNETGDKMITAVIFDFDGTIVDTETLWYKIFKEIVMTDYEMTLPLEEFAKSIGTTDDILFDYLDQQLGKSIDRIQFIEKVSARFQDFRDTLVMREGVYELIKECSSLGLKLGIASSSSLEWVESYLEKFNIKHYFQTIKTKEHVKKVKPDPELYIKAMEALKVQPKEALAIEDSVNGSIAALTAGMACAVIPNEVTEFLNFHKDVLLVNKFSDVPLQTLIKTNK